MVHYWLFVRVPGSLYGDKDVEQKSTTIVEITITTDLGLDRDLGPDPDLDQIPGPDKYVTNKTVKSKGKKDPQRSK